MVILPMSGTKAFESINSYSNGNRQETAFNNGILTARSQGEGIFALAVYRENELLDLKIVQGRDELHNLTLNTVIEDGEDKTIKVFRWDEDCNPICVNKELTPDIKNERIYLNHTFDDPDIYKTEKGVTVEDGQLEIVSTSAGEGATRPRYEFGAPHNGRYMIYEAEYKLPYGTSPFNCRLVNTYYTHKNGTKDCINSMIAMNKNGGIYRLGESGSILGTISSDKFTKISLKMDFELNTYDIYVDRQPVATGKALMPDNMHSDTVYDGKNFFIGHVSDDGAYESYIGSLLVDNIRVYEGTDFLELTDKLANVSNLDFSSQNPKWQTGIYERPSGAQLASGVMEKSHPRVLIDSQKINNIRQSTDATIVNWRDIVVSKADLALGTMPFGYKLNSAKSLENLDEAMELVMNLGLAYHLSDNVSKKAAYASRAYSEIEKLYNAPYKLHDSTLIPEDSKDYWNSYSYLDVAEVSFIMALCYDWFYDALTHEQKEAIVQNTMEKSLTKTYKALFNQKLPAITSKGWYKTANNWNAVCNGSMLISALAFMEEDAYLCAAIAEDAIRGFEYMLPEFAPSGAWAEGADYWAYTLKYLSAAMATLNMNFGTDFGLSKTPGLYETVTYSLSLEGKTAVVNLGDSTTAHVDVPFVFYLAECFKEPSYGGAALYMKKTFGFEPGAFDLIYYNPAYVTQDYVPDLSFYYEGTEVASFASGHEADDTFILISGGKGTATGHDHLDSGGVVLDMKGKRLLRDSGAEHYGANGYFSSNRYLYMRARPEGHNIFVINPQNQKDLDGSVYYGQSTEAVSRITSYEPEEHSATMDLSAAYSRDAKSASRAIALDGDNVLITDTIVLFDGGDDIYWSWYIMCGDDDIVIDGTKALVNLDGTEYEITFEANEDFTLEIQRAEPYCNRQEPYAEFKHSNEHLRRICLKMTDVSGEIILKTHIK